MGTILSTRATKCGLLLLVFGISSPATLRKVPFVRVPSAKRDWMDAA